MYSWKDPHLNKHITKKTKNYILSYLSLYQFVWLSCYGGLECYNWIGELRVFPIHYETHFWQHSGNFIGFKSKCQWWVVWMTAVWSLWKKWNDILFSNVMLDIEICDLIKFKSWNWLKANMKGFNCSLFNCNMEPLLYLKKL